VQLTDIVSQFEAMGINVATITYDAVDVLKIVEEDQGIEFPLLHDEAVSHVNAFGIRNLDYEPGERAYGIPYPGMFLVSPDGIIKFKFAEESFRNRPDFANVLEAAATM
jgi:peroxiredoxin